MDARAVVGDILYIGIGATLVAAAVVTASEDLAAVALVGATLTVADTFVEG